MCVADVEAMRVITFAVCLINKQMELFDHMWCCKHRDISIMPQNI